MPTYVQYGAADFGVAGKDVLLEHGGEGLYQPIDLNIASLPHVGRGATPASTTTSAVRQGARLRVATKFVQTAREHFAAKGVHVDLIKLYGSMELAPLVGLSDAIVDVVSTGSTLRANNLVEVEKIMDISSRLVVNQAALKLKRERLQPILEAFERASDISKVNTMTDPDPQTRFRRSRTSNSSSIRCSRSKRPPTTRSRRAVAAILHDVKARGDAAVLEYTNRFDRVSARQHGRTSTSARPNCRRRWTACRQAQRDALQVAADRIRVFHERQKQELSGFTYTEPDGTVLGQRITPLDRVGIYVPGGKAAYPSSVLMNAIPGQGGRRARKSSWWCRRRTA